MPARDESSTTSVELEVDEVALIIGEDDGNMSVRVVAGSDVTPEGSDIPAAPEIVLALAMRLLKDPDFHDDVLDWYYEHQDDPDGEDDEEEEAEEKP
jgi:hypothetical protein